MKTTMRKACDALMVLVCAALFTALLLVQPMTAQAQWTTPDANNNINNTNTGNVGVGTNAPAAKLTVSNNTQAAPAGQPGTTTQIVAANGVSTRLLVDSFGVATSSIDMRRANTTAASPSALFNGDMIGQITWQGRAKELSDCISDGSRFGKPERFANSTDLLNRINGQKGIVFVRQFGEWTNRFDHIDLWNGSGMAKGGNDYFTRDPSYILFWPINR